MEADMHQIFRTLLPILALLVGGMGTLQAQDAPRAERPSHEERVKRVEEDRVERLKAAQERREALVKERELLRKDPEARKRLAEERRKTATRSRAGQQGRVRNAQTTIARSQRRAIIAQAG